LAINPRLCRRTSEAWYSPRRRSWAWVPLSTIRPSLPADVCALLEQAHAALQASRYPTLLFAGNPGALIAPAFAERFAATLTDCRLVQLGAGAHCLQEDHPDSIGRSVATWIGEVESGQVRTAAA
jgi:haloalkane dehalogenase